MTAKDISKALRALGSRHIADTSQRFFKTGPGQYGEGDRFLGIRVPDIRLRAKAFDPFVSLSETLRLLHSPFHEERLCALLILVRKYEKGRPEEQQAIFEAYLENTSAVNNWDLVDLSASHIVGAHLLNRSAKDLRRLAQSNNLWERRIAVVATYAFIKNRRYDEILAIARRLMNDPEDLIHKAAGWMLREAGKRDVAILRAFLQEHARSMPRTMLRYAIEKFPDEERKRYLAMKSSVARRVSGLQAERTDLRPARGKERKD